MSSSKFYVFPASDDTNEAIVKNPMMQDVEPIFNAKCYFGKNAIELPLFEIKETLFKVLKKSKNLSFYIFSTTEEGRKQFIYSQNINKKSNNIFVEEIKALLEKMEKIIVPVS